MADTRKKGQKRSHKKKIESTNRFEYIESIAKSPGVKGVYEVKDTRDNITKAIKIQWNVAISRDKAFNEWNLWRELNNRKSDTNHIVRLYCEPVKLKNVWASVMEIADASLEEIIGEREKISKDEAIDIVTQAALGVKEAHLIGLSHSDLKPANLLLFESPKSDWYHVKVGDFENSTQSSHPTSTEKGTKGYMAPEALKVNNTKKCIYSPESDIYSLGVILFQLLDPNYETPFVGEQSNLYNTQMDEEQTLIKKRLKKSKADEELKQIILKCLKPHPEDRYRNVDDFLADLQGEVVIKPVANPKNYDEFIKEYDKLMEILNKSDLHKATKYNTASIDDIEDTYNFFTRIIELNNVLRSQDFTGYTIDIPTEIKQKLKTARDKRREEAEKDQEGINKYLANGGGFGKITDQKTQARTLLEIYQTTLCTGPPLSMDNKNRQTQGRSGKERYSKTEIESDKYEEAINPDTLRILKKYAK